jgi:hypothetical protein
MASAFVSGDRKQENVAVSPTKMWMRSSGTVTCHWPDTRLSRLRTRRARGSWVYLKIKLILQEQMIAGIHGLFRWREEMIRPAVLGTEDMERLNMS